MSDLQDAIDAADGLRAMLDSDVGAIFLDGMLLPTPEYAYPGPRQFVLAHGEEHPVKPVPDFLELGPMRFCFNNAFDVVADAPERYTYMEGYGLCPSTLNLPVLHAWVLDTSDGHIFDVTWPPTLADGEPRGPVEYFGVPFPFGYVDEITTIKGSYGLFNCPLVFRLPWDPSGWTE